MEIPTVSVTQERGALWELETPKREGNLSLMEEFLFQTYSQNEYYLNHQPPPLHNLKTHHTP